MIGSIFRSMILGLVIGIMILIPMSVASADSPTSHTVAWGETLYSIARIYNVSPQAIASANNINVNAWVYAGTRLIIPSGSTVPVSSLTPSGYYTVRAGDTFASIAAQFGVTANAISSANNLPLNGVLYVGWLLKIPTTSSNSKPASITHIVQPGEYLVLIAVRYGTTAQAIAMANSLSSDWMIYSGQRLNIPMAAIPVPVAPNVTNALNLRLANVPLYQQKQTLTCEEAAAAMAARGAFTENQLVAVMPRNANPFEGIRGNTNSAYFGGLSDYGVYAQGLQKGLAALGVKSDVLYGASFDVFKNAMLDHLRVGRPVVWWHTWQDSYQLVVNSKMPDGKIIKLVPYEHASVIVGANDRGVTYNDPYDASVRFISWVDFQRVSGYFDNMGLVIQQ